MKNLIIIFFVLTPNFIFCQQWFLGYGSEINFTKPKFSGTINNKYDDESYSYDIDIDETITNLSWSSFKVGFLTPNQFYFGFHGSYISPLLDEGKVLKDNLWKKRIDISNYVYGDGSITHEAKASFKYERYFGLDLGYDLTNIFLTKRNISIFGGISIYYHDKYFGEVIESFRHQYYARGSKSKLYYTENGEYKVFSKVAASFKILAMFKYIYLDISIGQVNSLGAGFFILI